MSYLGVGGEWVDGGESDAKGKQREVEDGDLERGRGDNQGDVVFGEGGEGGAEGEGEGFCLAEEVRVGEAEAGGGVDEERGGGEAGRGWGAVEESESVVGEGEGLGWGREADGRAEAVEGFGLVAEAAAWVDCGGGGVWLGCFRHWSLEREKCVAWRWGGRKALQLAMVRTKA